MSQDRPKSLNVLDHIVRYPILHALKVKVAPRQYHQVQEPCDHTTSNNDLRSHFEPSRTQVCEEPQYTSTRAQNDRKKHEVKIHCRREVLGSKAARVLEVIGHLQPVEECVEERQMWFQVGIA